MKFKEVLKIMKQSRYIALFEGAGCQWLSDGNACYPIHGLPHIRKDNLRTLIDYNDKQWGDVSIIEDSLKCDEGDPEETDVPLNELPISISYYGCPLAILASEHKLYYISPRYLKPFTDDSDYTYYARTLDDGSTIIVAYEGFFPKGFIIPYDLVSDPYMDVLKEITSKSQSLLTEKKQRTNDQERIKNFLEGDAFGE